MDSTQPPKNGAITQYPATSTAQSTRETLSSNPKAAKTDLFNNMIGSHSQQVIVTTPIKSKGRPGNLERSNSLNSYTVVPMENHPQILASDSGAQPNRSGMNVGANNGQLRQQTFSLEDLKKEPVVFSRSRNRWYTNEEVASILTNFSSHPEWQTNELQMRPKSGAVLLYSREKVRYRQDGYCWKKRKNGRTTREDHMKLKVQGIECIYGCYVHSAILPTFHRRCYWLLENPDIVLVHYLNQPPDDQNKMMITFNSSLLEADTRRSWTNEEIIEEIGSVFGGISQIQQTLNLSFPPQDADALLHQDQSSPKITSQEQSKDPDRMIESSPQSQATTNSESNNSEQIDMTVTDLGSRKSMLQNLSDSNATDSSNNQHHEIQNSLGTQELVQDELMAIGQESECASMNICSNLFKHLDSTKTSCNQNNNANMSEQELHYTVDGHNNQHRPQDETISMTLDVVNQSNEDQANISNSCYSYSRSTNQLTELLANHESTHAINDSNNNNVGDTATSDPVADHRSSTLTMTSEIRDQNKPTRDEMDRIPCSPVTQIFNKIVDDIETYALPLEPSHQFNADHHMHHHHHHHGITMSALPIQPMDIGESERDMSEHRDEHPSRCRTHHTAIENSRANLEKDQVNCSMNLSCDLFANESSSGCDRNDPNDHHGQDDEDHLLLEDFNLPSDGVVSQTASDTLGSSVVDSINNVDDLRDLIMGIPSDGNDNHNNILVDTNSIDLFNFKSADTKPKLMQHSQHPQQLDIKSSLSDTDTLNRLSPLITPQVPRCNSTGNAVQSFSSSSILTQHLSTSNFLGSNTLEQELLDEKQSNKASFHDPFLIAHHQTQHRSCSSATNPSSSTSCSPSSSNSFRAGILCRTEGCSQYTSHTPGSSSQPFIRLPFQQRQSSEQHESSGGPSSPLLPKALSIDGSDLAANHRVLSSPIGFQCIESKMRDSKNSLYRATGTGQGSDVNAKLRLASLSPSIPLETGREAPVHSYSDYDCSITENRQSNVMPISYQQNQQQLSLEQPSDHSISNNESSNGLLPILDYSPNWCSVSGGAKVLIVGNWSDLLISKNDGFAESRSGQEEPPFYVIFDDILVPASLIQDNVLRCYAPSHSAGFISLKILYLNQIVSEQVIFEMRQLCSRVGNQSNSSNYTSDGGNDRHDPSKDQDDANNPLDRGLNYNTHGNCSLKNDRKNSSSSSTSASRTEGSNEVNNLNNRISLSQSMNSVVQSTDNLRVLTMAENIISAMNRRGSPRNFHQDSRLANSSDTDVNLDSQYHLPHRHHSLKGPMKRFTGTRSLSRDSEIPTSFNSLSTNSFRLSDIDPYWNQEFSDSIGGQQPFSVVTNLSPLVNSPFAQSDIETHSHQWLK